MYKAAMKNKGIYVTITCHSTPHVTASSWFNSRYASLTFHSISTKSYCVRLGLFWGITVSLACSRSVPYCNAMKVVQAGCDNDSPVETDAVRAPTSHHIVTIPTTTHDGHGGIRKSQEQLKYQH